jgi:hypothetical protein
MDHDDDEHQAPRAARIVLTAAAEDGDTLDLVAYPDGRYGISRAERPLPDQVWPPNAIGECVDALLRLAGLV